MKLIEMIVREVKRIVDVVKKNTIAKVSIAVAIALAIRKIITMQKMTSQ